MKFGTGKCYSIQNLVSVRMVVVNPNLNESQIQHFNLLNMEPSSNADYLYFLSLFQDFIRLTKAAIPLTT